MSTKKGIVPRRSPDPRQVEIRRRAAEVRSGWTADTEQLRRVELVESVVYWPMSDADWLPSVEWDTRIA